MEIEVVVLLNKKECHLFCRQYSWKTLFLSWHLVLHRRVVFTWFIRWILSKLEAISNCNNVWDVMQTADAPLFIIPLTNFPFLSSNIPSSPAYGVFISQLIRYARASSSYECFILRAVRLSNKLLGQGYVKERLRSSLRKFYGRYGDLTKQYAVPLSRMLHDILDGDHQQWHPPLIRHYTNFWPYYWSWPYNRIWLFT